MRNERFDFHSHSTLLCQYIRSKSPPPHPPPKKNNPYEYWDLSGEGKVEKRCTYYFKNISGYAAGQIYYDSKSTTRFGGPGNMLCLPNNPELSNKTAPGNSNIYGSEFEENRFGHGSLQEDVPCALCRSRNSTTSVMIPGRKTCYKGWNIEYNGLLASSCNHCKASSYVCVDTNPEYIPGGETDDNHNLLYTTGTICGSLPCPPYHNNLELFCVVCSK